MNSIWSSVALRKSPQKPYVVNVSIKSFANWMWVSFFFVLYAILCLGFMFQKKNVWWLWYGSSSCLCCTLLKGNCLEGHQNLKGIVYGVIKILPSINSFMPFLPLPPKKGTFCKIIHAWMLYKTFSIPLSSYFQNPDF